MKLLILLTFTVAVFAISADAQAYKNDKCYKKVVNCCFKYAACGYIPKAIPSDYGCDFKKCEDKCGKVCKDVCKDVKETIPKKTCVPAYKKVCKKSADYYGGWISKCSQVADGEKCTTTNTYKTKKVCNPYCEKKCKKVCYTVKASCSKTKSVKYAKWCAGLKCEKEAVEGDSVKPSDHVEKKEIFVSETKPIRKEYK